MKWFLAGVLVCWAKLASTDELEVISKDVSLVQVQCQVGTEWESFCHQCRCLTDGTAHCEKKEPCDPSVTGEPITCKPNTIFKNGCSVCRCLVDGQVTCNSDDCQESSSEILKKPELSLGKECALGSEWTSQCNQCTCNAEGYPVCTEDVCPGQENERVLRCAPDTFWMDDCNTCWCTHNGYATCTKMGCDTSDTDFHVEGDEDIKQNENTASGDEIKVILIDDQHNLLKRSVCKPNKEFKMDCNPCKCAADGQSFTCERNECMETDIDPKINKDVEVFMKSEGVDHIERHSQLVCKPSTIFSIGCNSCYCNRDGSDFDCTNKPCPLPKDVEVFRELKALKSLKTQTNGTKAIICSANRMFIKDCNTCWCNEDGTSYFCTRKVCIVETPEDLSDETPEKEEKLNQKCRPDEVFEMDCNMCRCNADGTSFSCTRRACYPDDDSKDASISRKTRAAPQEPPKQCQPGQVFRLDCNKCLCDNEGQDFSCTRIDCTALKNTINSGARSKRDTTEELSANCTAGSVYQQDCNVCRCGLEGRTATCTTHNCDELKADGDSVNAPATDPNFRCNPGEQFKSECNDCTCTADGKSVFCTLRLCPIYKP